MQTILFLALGTVNLVSFLLCGWDKFLAVHKKRRIRERTLLTLSVLFGAGGFFCGMVLFHHKTKDKAFMPWVPLLLLLQLFLFAWGYPLLFG